VSPLTAQEGTADAGARIGWVALTGDDFSAAKDAVGFEGFLRWVLPSGVAIQGGAHYARHDIESAEDALGLLTIYLEPRYMIPVSFGVRGASPFIGVRGAYGRFENISGQADLNADGWGVGGVGGLLLPITPQLGIELSIWYSYLKTGTAKRDNLQIPNSSLSGGLLAFQLAIFGSTGR
jgi:hypothetical protein